MKGIVRGQRNICLLDIGASHNFKSSRWVSNRKLQIEDIPKFEVRLAGGERLRCVGKVSGLSIHFDYFLLKANFYVVDLDGLDVMLGRQRLQIIGRYTVQHDKMQLEFL